MSDDATRSTPDPVPTDLPPEIEEQVYALFFATQESDRDGAVAELANRHGAHAHAIRALKGKLEAGAGIFGALGSVDTDALPEKIDGYKVLGKLGEGGFGVVYLAEQFAPIRRRVAIKCLLPGMDSRKVLARFEAERQALAMMNHANIATVFDARGDAEGRPYFVMEYVPGEPITTYCDRQRLTTNERLALFAVVCDAVQHAHQKGVIHRDLKPSNVLVMEEDGKPIPKIIDFGVAKAIYQPLTMMTIFTAVGRMVGTPAYMSPEQTSPTPLDVDTRTDIYSLGVMLYELLTGSLPFTSKQLQGQGLEAIQRVVRESEPPRPSQRVTTSEMTSGELAALRRTQAGTLIEELRGDLDWIVMRAMEKDRVRRYATALELAADLERHLKHEPVLARPPQVSYLLRKYVRRHRTQVIAGLAVGLAVVAGLVFSTIFYVRAERNLAQANKNLDAYDRLSDLVLVDWCLREAKELWPEREETVAAMQTWLEKARPLASRLPQHRKVLAEVGKRKATANADGKPVFVDHRDQFLYETLHELVEKLAGFAHSERGLVRNVEGRMARAETARQASIGDHKAEWGECIAALAKDERFLGLALEPQVGLVPISPDPKTGLWEFAHLRTGEPTFREFKGGLMSLATNGLVFVLVPGGEFRMGSQDKDPAAPNYVAPKEITPYEKPVHTVKLAPFFISKYEVTQQQWFAFTGINPSRFRPGKSTERVTVSMLHPVESVSCQDAILVLGRLSLQLPSEAQWEYACRAGSGTRWSTGDEPESLKGQTNLCDEGSAKFYPGKPTQIGFKDGYALHAPVGIFPANEFGLHDMTGNVSEWTRDWFLLYENPTDPIDGLRTGEKGKSPYRMSRGGNYSTTSGYCRSALRSAHNPNDGSFSIGLRPVRMIER